MISTKKITNERRQMGDVRNNPIEKYNAKAPKTIGFLVNLYGPLITNVFVRGVTAMLNPSVGPPLPVKNKDKFDQIIKNNPTMENGREMINLKIRYSL